VREVAPDGVDGLVDTALLNRRALPAIRDGGVLVPVRGWEHGEPERGIQIRPVLVSTVLERTDWLEQLRELASRHTIQLRVAAVYPPEKAADAQRAMQAGGLRGRAVFKETVSPLRGSASEKIGPTLELLGLEAIADELPGELSQGQGKLVGIARALVANPRVVCLDEPAAGLDTHESDELGRRLRALVDGGQSMLLVDHDMGLVLGICDEVVVLEFGRAEAATGRRARATQLGVRRDSRIAPRPHPGQVCARAVGKADIPIGATTFH
jgi:ATPase subunit of ABC transporter with duplicated ATPase domains